VRIAAFEIDDPLPELNEPYAFAMLRPWIDVNNVGTSVLDELETQFEAKDLARLAKPGLFFDFTRYRPTLYHEEGNRRVSIPNVTVRYAWRKAANDFLFLRLLEPHALSEVYVDSVLRLLKTLKVKKYVLLGSMSDVVPHTKPLIVHGGAIGRETGLDLKRSQAHVSHYQGPTSVTTLITQRVSEIGAEAIWFVVSLPQYVALEEDYVGKIRLMEILNLLYHIPIDTKDFEKAVAQRNLINKKMEGMPELKRLLPQLEAMYDARIMAREEEGKSKLSSDIEEILWKISGKDFGKA